MFKLLVNSISSYVDGSYVPKILGRVSAYWWDETMPEFTETPDPENPDVVIKEIFDGQHLADISIALDAMTIAQVVSQESPEAAKDALNKFVIDEAQKNSLMSIESLKTIKDRLDNEATALWVSNAVIQAIEPLVIWPARIPYPEEEAK